MYGNGRPITKRQMVRLTLALTIIAWATQTLFRQWGYGAELRPVAAQLSPVLHDTPASANDGMPDDAAGSAGDASRRAPSAAEMRFIAPRAAAAASPGATLQLRSEATTNGPEVRLRQIARWSNREAGFFEPVADLVVLRLEQRGPYTVIDLELVRKTLRDAGVNPALVRFSGPQTCSVNRADVSAEPGAALSRWIDASEKPATTPPAAMVAAARSPTVASPVVSSSTAGSSNVASSFATPSIETKAVDTTPLATPAQAAGAVRILRAENPANDNAPASSVRALRDALSADLAVRLSLPIDLLQVQFNPKDDRVLNLCEPQFRFNIEAVRVRNLGEVAWNVTLVAQGGDTQKVGVVANARAWQNQVVVNRPIAGRSPLRQQDLVERRTLIDRLPDEPPLAITQCLGQQASRDLKPGTVLTGRLIESIQLARPGDLITVTVNRGGVQIKSVARAAEGGTAGQHIKVRHEVTNEVFDVVLTGPQEGSIGG